MRIMNRKDSQRTQRIIATLLSLAGLADRASLQNWFVRFCALWFLRSAATVAHRHVAETMPAALLEQIAGDFDVTAPPEIEGFSAQDAILLAYQLRMLAALLSYLATTDDIGSDQHPGDHIFVRWAAGRACSLNQILARRHALYWLPQLFRRPEMRLGLAPGYS